MFSINKEKVSGDLDMEFSMLLFISSCFTPSFSLKMLPFLNQMKKATLVFPTWQSESDLSEDAVISRICTQEAVGVAARVPVSGGRTATGAAGQTGRLWRGAWKTGSTSRTDAPNHEKMLFQERLKAEWAGVQVIIRCEQWPWLDMSEAVRNQSWCVNDIN